MSTINLQNKPIVIGTPVEIELAVNEIRKVLAGGLTWLTHPYFIAQRFYKLIDGRSFYFPETFAPTAPGSNEYQRLTPDNDFKGMSFFLVGDGDIDFEANSQNFIEYPVSIIFGVNLRMINTTKADEGLFTQELMKEARRLLTNTMINHMFDYTLDSETRELREVYREFTLQDIDTYNRAPMQCFRFDLNVRIQEECD
ncbi:MAG: hypothetical protein KAJ19_20905 [Gammaproteobacteria bacterium]|nr:hypothetical protein [Gammaproteobacteria bacterium]